MVRPQTAMKVVILAGGLGTRLSEVTELRPKPMVEIGDEPILWHIMKSYAHHGFREFVVALGYKGDVIKRYFLDLRALGGSLKIDLASGAVHHYETMKEDWTVHCVETGLQSNTGGRLRRLRDWIGNETFLCTYGDGVSDVDVPALVAFHKKVGRAATVTAVRPPARFGGLEFDGDLVRAFTEKPQIGEGWINGGFMVLEPKVLDHLTRDEDSLEIQALEKLAAAGQLAAYKHDRFWQCMDTLRDVRYLERLWAEGKAPWKVWR